MWNKLPDIQPPHHKKLLVWINNDAHKAFMTEFGDWQYYCMYDGEPSPKSLPEYWAEIPIPREPERVCF